MPGAWNAGSIVSKLTLDKSKWSSSVQSIEKDQKSLGSKITQNAASFKKFGMAATIAGGAIVGAFGLAVKSAVDFNREMASVATLIPGSTKRVIELKGAVQDLATTTGKSTGDIAGGLYQVISAFGDTADTAKILEVNVLAAAAGMATTTDSINLTSAVMKGYGDVSLAATKKVGDLAFQAVKLGQTTFPELAASMGKVIPIAAKLGISQEELFTGYATLTGVTGSAAEVTTQLRGVLAAMMKPTEDMATAIGKLGFASAETMIQELGLQGSLGALIETTDGSTESVGKLFSSVESLPAVFALTGSQAEIFNEKLDKMKDSSGAMDEAFKEMSEGINFAGFNMARLKEMTIVLTQRIGDSLAPAIGGLVVSVGKIVSKVSEWIKEHPKLTQIIAKAALGFGALMAALGPLLMALPGLLAILPKIGKALRLLAANPIGLIITGLVIIAEKTRQAINTFKDFSESLSKYLEASGEKMSWLEKTWAGVTATIHKHVYGVDAAKFATEKYAEMTEEARKAMLAAIKDTGLHTKALDALTSAFGWLIPKAEAAAEGLEDLGEKGKPVIMTLEDIRKKAEELGILEDTRTYAERLEDQLWDLRGELANGLITWQEFINKSALITTATGNIKDEFSDLALAIEDDASAFIDYGDTVNTVLEDMGLGMGSFTEDTRKAATKTKSLWEDMADGLQTKWASALGEILRGATSFKDGLKGVWDAIVVQFTDMIGQMIAKWMAGFIGKILTSLTSKFVPGVEDAMGDAASSAAGASTSIGASMATAFNVGIIVAWAAAAWSVISGWGDQMNIFWEEQRGLIDDYIDSLKKLGRTWREIKDILGEKEYVSPRPRPPIEDDKIPGKGGGIGGRWGTGFEGIIDQPTLALIGESGPEAVSVRPLSQGQPSAPSNITVNNNVILNGTVITDRDYARKRMIPEMLSALEANFEKTKMKQILGIA